MILTPNVVEEAVVKIRQGAVSVIIPEHTTGEGFWASVIAFEHSLFQEYNTGIPRFFTRKVFDESGGYDEMMTGPEDRDLALRVAKLGPCALIDAEIIHDIGHISYFQTCAKAGYYAPGRALFSHKHGMEETKRVFKQQPWLRKHQKLLNPLGIGLFILKIGEILTASSVILSQKLHSGRSKLDPYK
jgi:GT2 family glycosyltransferase